MFSVGKSCSCLTRNVPHSLSAGPDLYVALPGGRTVGTKTDAVVGQAQARTMSKEANLVAVVDHTNVITMSQEAN